MVMIDQDLTSGEQVTAALELVKQVVTDLYSVGQLVNGGYQTALDDEALRPATVTAHVTSGDALDHYFV